MRRPKVGRAEVKAEEAGAPEAPEAAESANPEEAEAENPEEAEAENVEAADDQVIIFKMVLPFVPGFVFCVFDSNI